MATATLRGTVRDPAGAVVPATQVTLTQRDTNVEHSTTTDATGSFVFAAAPPGNYTLTASHVGFATMHTDVQLQVGQSLNLRLKLNAANSRLVAS